MDFENVCKLMECFDSSESVYLELEMPEFSIKLKKAEAYKDTVAPAMAPMPAMQMPECRHSSLHQPMQQAQHRQH